MDLPGQKVYRRVQVRLLMEEGAFCRLSLSRDGGEWEPKGDVYGPSRYRPVYAAPYPRTVRHLPVKAGGRRTGYAHRPAPPAGKGE